MKLTKYDFLDFGASKGASIEYAQKHFSGKRGMGVDLDPKRVKAMRDSGYDCMVGDITKLDVPANSVRFVKMSHILEHMPSLTGVEKAIISGVKAATDFIVITGPFFDQDAYLKKLGFKLHWSDYPEHTCHLRVADLVKILDKLKLPDYELYMRYKIADSSSDHIHPLTSPAGAHRYNPDKHPAKKQKKFDRDIWIDFVCYIQLKSKIDGWEQIRYGYANQIPFVLKSKGKKLPIPQELFDRFVDLDARDQQHVEKIKSVTDYVHRLKTRIARLESQKSLPSNRYLRRASRLVRRGSG